MLSGECGRGALKEKVQARSEDAVRLIIATARRFVKIFHRFENAAFVVLAAERLQEIAAGAGKYRRIRARAGVDG